MKKIIALIGLMGVGKSTLGAKLADNLGYYFIDTDQEIEDREKKLISEIFSEKGEPYFRQIEKNLIKEIVSRDENIVLSLGGGSYINDESRKIIRENCHVFWIYAPIDVIMHRVGNKNNRPLLNNSDKRKVLDNLALKRYPIYKECDLKFDTNAESHETIINKIKNYLSK